MFLSGENPLRHLRVGGLGQCGFSDQIFFMQTEQVIYRNDKKSPELQIEIVKCKFFPSIFLYSL